jgi:AraC-like DNA-binding protein
VAIGAIASAGRATGHPCARHSLSRTRHKGAILGVVRSATSEEFGSDPIGRYVLGRNWLYFCAHAGFAGYVAWDRIELPDLLAVAPIVQGMHTRARERYRAIVDLRRVSFIAEAAFEATARYATTHQARMTAAVDRVAMVRSAGFMGAVARGYFEVVPRPYLVGVFSAPKEALTWLEREGDQPVFDELEAIVAQAAGSLRDLREFLDAKRERPSLEAAARHLGLTPRTLQRRLRDEGSSFQNELMAARLRAAQRLMLESDAPLTEIAFNAGFASPAHLSTQFRKVLGVAPSEWRARHRG